MKLLHHGIKCSLKYHAIDPTLNIFNQEKLKSFLRQNSVKQAIILTH